MWAQLKLCQYNFIMVTRRAQDQVKEPRIKQRYQTTVSIEWLPCLCMDAASYHEVCPKNATTWVGRVDWNLHFHLLKESHWNYDANQKAFGNPISKTTNANTTDTMNLYVSRCCWAKNFVIHALRPPIKKNNRATKSKQPRIELRINKPKPVHLPGTLIFHIWSKEENET